MKTVLALIDRFAQRFPEAARLFEENGVRLEVRPSLAALTEQDYQTVVASADALIPGPGIFDSGFLDQMKNLKILCRIGSGMDTIDVAYLRQKGVEVTNTKGQNANAVAEHTLGLTLCMLRGISQGTADLRDGLWQRSPGVELSGKTVGLVGFGIIARRFRELLVPFGVTVLVHDPFVDAQCVQDHAAELCCMDELLSRSDIVSLHLPATLQNTHLMDERAFAKMKAGSCLVNCARGSLVDSAALEAAIRTGRLAGAALDTFEDEPVTGRQHTLLAMRQVVSTPHLGGTTRESMIRDGESAAEQIITFLEGER